MDKEEPYHRPPPHGHPHGRSHGPKAFMGCFPFDPHTMRKLKKMAGHFMRGFMGNTIPYNVEDLGDDYLITVPLAGRTKEEVKVSLINNNLNIKAEKPKIPERDKIKEKPEEETAPHECCGPFFQKGFTFIDVDMDIPLPADAQTNSIVSKMANGLLKITMGKKPPKSIDVS
jgi:HSP20 family molecular chaperone IbpA